MPDFSALITLRQIRRAPQNWSFMFDNKYTFTAVLSDQFRISAKWRTGQAKRFSHDPRNVEAAERLLRLQSQIALQDEVWNYRQPLVSNPACLTAISETNRDVGFRTKPNDFTAWLEHLHANLTGH